MDQKITAYIESLVLGILSLSQFVSLSQNQKAILAEKLRGKFYDVILTTTVNNLTDEQVIQLQNYSPDSDEMEKKLEEFAAQLPDLATSLEKKLNEEYQKIKQNPQEFL